ncbi:hypothetical protein ASG49_14475 [Marmoricola sp. Leaf446]|uniref:GAF and ANTAR domain-containing protein n=1 Tax=Marmoricola sp. Leaf446 TaxID=1736379 RepID=UPI0006F8B6EC|nr:GAF and ANTAR domain-containing protein [Marmoricola sp. Leaf446]KQT90916.1 hypothetical protein ASG49_14475 [Marmoricola sp. Leaf446]
MGPSRDATLLTAIAAELQEHPTEDATVADVLDRAVALLPPADHASLTVRRRHVGWHTVGATSPLALRADELQYALEEGPCVEAYDAADHRHSDRVADDPRWPRWGPAADDLGLRSVLSIGLQARGERVASLNLYAAAPEGFGDPSVVELARLYAVHASYALHSAHRRAGLESAIGSRHVIGVAQGMLVERFGLDLESSFALLQRLSSTHNRKLRDICEELVRTGDTPGLAAGPDAD